MFARKNETIAALATPSGFSAIAVIRISGPQSRSVLEALSSKKEHWLSHSVFFTSLKSRSGELLDQVLAFYMQGPRSFTGEDVVEIQCHGNPLVVRKILEACYANGARAAHPGEFSFRAFAAGKMDLTQAEALQGLIHAQSELALAAARSHLQGALSEKIAAFQQSLFYQTALLEAWLDFSEEGLETREWQESYTALAQVQQEIEDLIRSYHEGQLIVEGVRVVLLGPPNVGKSSLMNALLQKERSIVTDIKGTTRDTIEEEATLGSLKVRLVDTAGVREGVDFIEQEGIRRTWERVAQADLVLWLLDASVGYTDADAEICKQVPLEKTIVVWNKSDIARRICTTLEVPGISRVCSVSAQTGSGLELLKEEIRVTLNKQWGTEKPPLLLTSLRHKIALEEACEALVSALNGLKASFSSEFVCSDLRVALRALAQITGSDITEEILRSIFSTFCLGK